MNAPSPRPVAVVTGAASGLGRALARELSARGVHVVIADIDEARGRELEAELGAAPAGARFRRTDVTRFEEVDALVAGTIEREGRLDWMVNNAGVGVIGEARDMELRHWRRVIDVNVMGVVHGVQAAYPRMAAQGSGRIVNMASVAGLVPTPTGSAYAASKHAVVALSYALRCEARDLGVSVTVACPGFIRTGFGDAAEYLRVDRAKLFAPVPEDRAAQDALAVRILDGAMRGRAVVIHPPWLRLAWWAWRISPWACEWLLAPIAMRRHRRLRS